MSDDTEYLINYKADTLYVNPEKNGKGAYATFDPQARMKE